MLREETYAELQWDDGHTVRGLAVVWRGREDAQAFEGWLRSVRHAPPLHYRMPGGLESLAREAPWRGLLIAGSGARGTGGGQGPAVLLFRGREYRTMVLNARLAALPSVTESGRFSVEFQVIGLSAEDTDPSAPDRTPE